MTDNYDRKKYRVDFPIVGSFNWKTVKLIIPDDPYLDGWMVMGVVLHDGKFMFEGTLFDEDEFEVIDENPMDNFRKKIKQLWHIVKK